MLEAAPLNRFPVAAGQRSPTKRCPAEPCSGASSFGRNPMTSGTVGRAMSPGARGQETTATGATVPRACDFVETSRSWHAAWFGALRNTGVSVLYQDLDLQDRLGTKRARGLGDRRLTGCTAISDFLPSSAADASFDAQSRPCWPARSPSDWKSAFPTATARAGSTSGSTPTAAPTARCAASSPPRSKQPSRNGASRR